MVQLGGEDWLTMSEAAALIGLSVPRVSILVRDGRIPHTPVGRQLMIRKSDAAAFKKQKRAPGRPKKK